MKKSEWKNALRHSFTVLSPDDFETVLSECERKGRKPMEKKTVTLNAHRSLRIALLAAALAAVLVSALIVGTVLNRKDDLPSENTPAPVTEQTNNKTPAETNEPTEVPTGQTEPPTGETRDPLPAISASVYLDVNPGLRFDIAEDRTVVDVAATNADGSALIDGVRAETAGLQLNDALAKAVARLAEAGGISKTNDTVLLAVVANDRAEEKKIGGGASFAIEKSMRKSGVYGSVVTCSVQPVKRVADLADEYVISVSKAQFIIRLLDFDPAYPAERLASMTISELVELCKEWNIIVQCDINVTVKDAFDTAVRDLDAAPEDVTVRYRISQMDVVTDPGKQTCLWSLWIAEGEKNYGYHIDTATGEICKKVGPVVLPEEQEVVDLVAARYEERDVRVVSASGMGDRYQLYFTDYADNAGPVCNVQIYTPEGVYTVSINVLTGEDTLLNFLPVRQNG